MASETYSSERGGQTKNNYPALNANKISLMYMSDYAFASKKCYSSFKLWSSTLEESYYNSECRESNWMDMQMEEWTLVPSYIGGRVNFTSVNGPIIDNDDAYPEVSHYVRPSFYLKSNVNIIENGNDGTESKPYYLELGN